MVDRDDGLRHERIAQNASVRREKSQDSEAPVHSSHVKASTYGIHTSPSSSSRRRRVSPTDTSLPPSSHRRQVSPIQAPKVPESSVVPETPMPPPTDDASEAVPPLTDDASKPVLPSVDETVKPMPPLDGEAAEDDKSKPPQAFG